MTDSESDGDTIELLVSEMEAIRKKNNLNWMSLLRLAIQYAPEEEVITVLKSINKYDKHIQDLWPQMVDAIEDNESGC